MNGANGVNASPAPRSAFGQAMFNIGVLVRMQLKERLNFKRLDLKNVKVFNILVSIFGAILKFALITVLCAAVLVVAKLLGLFSLAGRPVPSTVISIVFTCMMVASVISCVVGLTKSMYYARDNAVLLTLPCTALHVYLSKLIIFFVFEVKRNFSFTVPLFIAYYATHSYGVGAYFWMLFCFLWISLFTVALGALLSIPAMWIANFARQHKWIQALAMLVGVSAAVVLVFFGISLIPENLDLVAAWDTTYWEIQDLLTAYSVNFAPIYDVTLMILGESKNMVVVFPFGSTALRFLGLLLSTVVLFGAGLLIVKPLFYKMASTPFEYLKRKVPPKKNRVLPRRFSAVYNEFLVALKSADRMFSNIGIMISIPMLIFLLNKIFLAMKTRELGDQMVIAFNILIILLIALNANCYASSIFSRDGRSSYLIKTQPSKYPILIVSKLSPNTAFVMVSFAATFGILGATVSMRIADVLLLAAAVVTIYISHLLYCAELDLMNPQVELYATVGSADQNPNETKATISAFAISFIVAGVVFLLLLERGSNVYFKLALAGVLVLYYRIHLFYTKLRVYYKEK